VTDWPPWLLTYIGIAAFGLLLIFLMFVVRWAREHEVTLLWGGLLPVAILLWFIYR
jgi:hypothetical protein